MLAVDPDAPLVIREGVAIQASPEVVFATLADLASWPVWQSNVSRMESNAVAAEGLTFRWRAGGASITSTVKLFKPPLALGWTGSAIGTNVIHTWRFSSEGTATRVEMEESMDGWLFSLPLLQGRIRTSMQNVVMRTLAELKDEAESRQAAATNCPSVPR
jgi:hypothetical protein